MIYHIKVTGQLNQLLQFTTFPFLTNMQAIYIIIFLHVHVVKYASIYMYIYIYIYNTDKLSYTTKQYYAKLKTLARWDRVTSASYSKCGINNSCICSSTPT